MVDQNMTREELNEIIESIQNTIVAYTAMAAVLTGKNATDEQIKAALLVVASGFDAPTVTDADAWEKYNERVRAELEKIFAEPTTGPVKVTIDQVRRVMEAQDVGMIEAKTIATREEFTERVKSARTVDDLKPLLIKLAEVVR